LECSLQIIGEASLENILEEIFGTAFTDLRRSLLRKYSIRCGLSPQLMKDPTGILNRGNIWDIIHRCWMMPSEKIF